MVLIGTSEEVDLLVVSTILEGDFLLLKNQSTAIPTTAIANMIETDFFTEQLPPILQIDRK